MERLAINGFEKGTSIWYDVFSVSEPDGYTDYHGHGAPNHIEVFLNGVYVIMDPEEFAVYLRTNEGYEGGPLRLVSCETAKGDNSFAQRLSAILHEEVMGADSDVYYAPEDGTVFVGQSWGNTGKWRRLKDGKEIT